MAGVRHDVELDLAAHPACSGRLMNRRSACIVSVLPAFSTSNLLSGCRLASIVDGARSVAEWPSYRQRSRLCRRTGCNPTASSVAVRHPVVSSTPRTVSVTPSQARPPMSSLYSQSGFLSPHAPFPSQSRQPCPARRLPAGRRTGRESPRRAVVPQSRDRPQGSWLRILRHANSAPITSPTQPCQAGAYPAHDRRRQHGLFMPASPQRAATGPRLPPRA